MTRNLKQALFSALLVWAVAYPVLGLKLTIVGINLEVHGTGPVTLTIIALCSVLMFLRVPLAVAMTGSQTACESASRTAPRTTR